MRRWLALAVVAFPARAVWGADGFVPPLPPEKGTGKPVSIQFIGEGGDYAHPSGGAADFLESAPRLDPGVPAPAPALGAGEPSDGAEDGSLPLADAPAAPIFVAPSRPAVNPAALLSSRRDAFVPRDPASRRGHETRDEARKPLSPRDAAIVPADRRRYALWEGLTRPLELPAEKVAELSPGQASEAVRRDYETHILGARPALVSASELAQARDAAAAPSGPAETFVALELDLRKSGVELKDAVAGLSRQAGFRLDSRFPAESRAADGRRVAVWGWLPSDAVGIAAREAAVLRVEVQRAGPVPALDDGLSSRWLVGIRLPASVSGTVEPTSVAPVFARVLADLRAEGGFVWKETVGYQAVPGSKDLALIVLGEAPVKRLARLMAHPDVLKVAPAPGSAAASAARRPTRLERFVSYAVGQAPWLLILTLLLIVPATASALLRAARVFVPYH